MSAISEMREICQLKKKNAEGKLVLTGQWFNRLFARKFTIYITWLFVKMGISPDFITFLMIPMGILGAAAMVPHILWLNVVGFVILFWAEMFDLIDGEMARWTQTSSIKGVYLDLVSHLLCNPLLPTICAFHLYFIYEKTFYLGLAFVTYAAAASHLELRNVSVCLRYQMLMADRTESTDNRTASAMIKKLPFPLNLVFILFKWIVFIGTDLMAIRLLTLISVVVSYYNTTLMKVTAYFFCIFELLWIIGEIGTRYFYRLPDKHHSKIPA